MIKIEGLRKSFGALEVLKGIDLTVNKGEVLCMIGGSGSGKSTLLMCINALEGIDFGRVEVNGIDVHAPGTDKNKLRQKIGIVFQQFNAFPHLTAWENVALAPRRVLGQSKAESRELAEYHLAHVGLGDKLDHFPSQLSGGQQQRVAIARSLVNNPKIIMGDEPTGDLDGHDGRMIPAEAHLRGQRDVRDGVLHRLDEVVEQRRAAQEARTGVLLDDLMGGAAEI